MKEQWPTLDVENAEKEFNAAVRAGLLDIHRFAIMETENIGAAHLGGTFQQSVQRIADKFTGVIMRTVSDSSTYPLFDDGTGSLVRVGVEIGATSPTVTRISQAKQTQLATDLLGRLPLFDEASMNEILDIRRELDPHLIRFRSAIIKYAEKIRNASRDKEFSRGRRNALQRHRTSSSRY